MKNHAEVNMFDLHKKPQISTHGFFFGGGGELHAFLVP